MEIGDLYLADVPFRDRPGSKERIVLIVKILSDSEVLILESRGKLHENLSLIGVIDFSRRGYPSKVQRHITFLQRKLEPAADFAVEEADWLAYRRRLRPIF